MNIAIGLACLALLISIQHSVWRIEQAVNENSSKSECPQIPQTEITPDAGPVIHKFPQGLTRV